MRDHKTCHNSYMQPVIRPELASSPVSPPDPGCSSPAEYSSPAQSDTLQTPIFDTHHSSKQEYTHIQLHSNEEHFTSRRGSPLMSQLFLQSSPTSSHKGNGPFLSFPEVAQDCGSQIDANGFEVAFSGGDHPRNAQYDSTPIHAISYNPLNIDAHPLQAGNISPSLDGRAYSFPLGHELNPHFLRHYQLEDELGSGGYGFVITARHRSQGHEVAVKFIIKAKVPDYAWIEDETIGRLPIEVMLLNFLDHENIVKCLDLFEDSLYFYLVQELHGSPWPKAKRDQQRTIPTTSLVSRSPSTPSLSPSMSTSSLASSDQGSSPRSPFTPPQHLVPLSQPKSDGDPPSDHPSIINSARPNCSRRPSHDLFECIEQSEQKRLSEAQARYVFSQVVDAVYYLDSQGIAHRDIKDENIVIDRNLKVKLIDFGSAAIVDPNEPRPYYKLFYGTIIYASSEILLKKEYQAAPAEVWTLGVLLSYLLTGTPPFPTVKDAIQGRIVLTDVPGARLSRTAMNLMRRCLDPNPKTRATIAEIKAHRWLA